MKKRHLLINIALIINAFFLSSCGADNKATDQNDAVSVASASDMQEEITTTDIEIEEDKDENIGEENEYGCISFEKCATDDLILNTKYSRVRQVVRNNVDEYSLQGVILVGVGDEIVYTEAFGKASQWDDIYNTNTTRFGIASLTKSFTAAAIMQLYEAGKLDINDTIDKYFPDYRYGDQITILELMQMRSGIIDYLNDMKNYMTLSDSKAIYDSFAEKNDWKGLDEYPWSREDMLKNLYNNRLLFDPDEQYSYCNTNYYLLGCIIEQVSGMDYDKYITENILTPCSMSSSNLSPKAGDAVGYMRNEGFVSSSYETLFSVGGIRSNVFDMYSWLRNLSTGNVVSEDSFSTMIETEDIARKNQLHYEKEQERLKKELGDEYEEPKKSNVTPTYYCCGLMVTGSEVWHRGYIDGFSNYMSVNLDTDVTIIILTNTSEDREIENITKLWNSISEATTSCMSK